jgi:hypothetical protein
MLLLTDVSPDRLNRVVRRRSSTLRLKYRSDVLVGATMSSDQVASARAYLLPEEPAFRPAEVREAYEYVPVKHWHKSYSCEA